MPTKDEISEFSQKIEKISEELKINYIDSICHHCEKFQMEIEVAATLISAALKAKIKEEAQSLNLIKKSSKLPI
jgi:hypothetical protein